MRHLTFFGLKCKSHVDSRKLEKKIKSGTFRSLTHAAAAVRITAKRSMRSRKDHSKSSPPGKPPYSHTKILRDSIIYDVDKKRETAVIGPKWDSAKQIGELHEYGGTQKAGKWQVRHSIEQHRKFGTPIIKRGSSIRYPARPFMRPAFEKNKHRLPERWANSIK